MRINIRAAYAGPSLLLSENLRNGKMPRVQRASWQLLATAKGSHKAERETEAMRTGKEAAERKAQQ